MKEDLALSYLYMIQWKSLQHCYYLFIWFASFNTVGKVGIGAANLILKQGRPLGTHGLRL